MERKQGEGSEERGETVDSKPGVRRKGFAVEASRLREVERWCEEAIMVMDQIMLLPIKSMSVGYWKVRQRMTHATQV